MWLITIRSVQQPVVSEHKYKLVQCSVQFYLILYTISVSMPLWCYLKGFCPFCFTLQTCHYSLHLYHPSKFVIGQVACYPKNSMFKGNLLTVGETSGCKDTAGRAKGKPEVYAAVIKLLSMTDQWIFDPLGGGGTYMNYYSTVEPLIRTSNVLVN